MEENSSSGPPDKSLGQDPENRAGSEQQLRHFITASSSIVYRMSADWKQMFTLDGKNMLEDTEQVTGNWVDRYIPLIDRQLVWETVDRAIAAKGIFELEHRVLQADGKVGWVLSRAVPVIGTDGRITEWVGSGTDISARKLAEEALRGSELRFRESSAKYLSLFNSIDQGFCVIKMLFDGFDKPYDYIFLEVNPVFEAQTGISNAVGKRMTELVPGHEQHWYDAYGQVARGCGSRRFEAQAAALGRWFDVYAFSVGLLEANQVALLFNDITDRKLAQWRQDFLLRLNAALRPLGDPTSVHVAVTNLAIDYFVAQRCFYAELKDGQALIRSDAFIHGLSTIAGNYPLAQMAGFFELIGKVKLLVVKDVADTDLIDTPMKELCISLGFVSFIALPVIKDSNAVGVFCVVQSRPRNWEAHQVEIAAEVSELTWAAVERSNAQMELAESRERLELALVGANIFSWDVDPITGKASYSENFNEVIGFEISEIAAENFVNLHPDDEVAVLAATSAAIVGETPLDIEHRVIVPGSGAVIWVRAQGRLVIKADGRPSFIGITQNITERKAAEEVLRGYNAQLEKQVAERTGELQQNFSLLQTVYDTNLIGMSVFSPIYGRSGKIEDFKIVIVNKKVERSSGRNDLIGKLYSEIFPGIKKMGLFSLMVETFLSGDPGKMEYHYTYEGVDRWYSTHFVKGGELLVSTNLDITERVVSEQERFRNYLLLQQSEDLAKTGSWDFDLTSNTFRWSEGMYKLFELDRGVHVTPDIYLTYVTKATRAIGERIVAHIKNGDSGFEETIELLVGGKVKVVHLKADVVSTKSGEPVRVLGVDMDVTAIRDAENRLLQLEVHQQQEIFRVTLNAQEEERRRISESLHNGLGQLLYGTRLSMNYMTLKMAFGNPTKFTESRNYTAELLSEAISETRRISHELMPTVLAEFGLKAAVKDVCEQLQDGVKFDCRVSLSTVKLDNYIELAVFRAVQELMVNVVRHAEASRCKVRVEADRSRVFAMVEDNGKGMDDVIGKPGIGLSSIRAKVELLKGRMDISSGSGGTKVEVTLPLQIDGGLSDG